MGMSGLPREVIKWLQSLDLSCPLKNVRRDFSNGHLIAEIMSWYYDKDVHMHSYSNGISLQTKLSNWQLLEKCFEKEKLEIPKEFIEGTIHCKPGAAIALLERLFVLLTNRELRYLPATGRPNDFNDCKYQSQLPLYARSTTARSIKTNLAATELTIEQDRNLASQKTQAIIEHHNEQKKHVKVEHPERFEYKSEYGGTVRSLLTTKKSTVTTCCHADKSMTDAEIAEVKVKQKHPPTPAT